MLKVPLHRIKGIETYRVQVDLAGDPWWIDNHYYEWPPPKPDYTPDWWEMNRMYYIRAKSQKQAAYFYNNSLTSTDLNSQNLGIWDVEEAFVPCMH